MVKHDVLYRNIDSAFSGMLIGTGLEMVMNLVAFILLIIGVCFYLSIHEN